MEEENHFTQIPNELLEALAKTKLSPYESRYVFAILRKTFGYHKKWDYIANSQFAKITGIKRPHICRTEKKLLARKIITCVGNKVGINASFDQWRELPAEVIITRRGKTVAYKGNKKLPAVVATKERKETIQKKNINSDKSQNQAYKLKIIFLYASKKGVGLEDPGKKQSFIKRYIRPAELLIPYEYQKIEEVMDWLGSNADFKWTLETVSKYIDEDLDTIKTNSQDQELIIPEYAKSWIKK